VWESKRGIEYLKKAWPVLLSWLSTVSSVKRRCSVGHRDPRPGPMATYCRAGRRGLKWMWHSWSYPSLVPCALHEHTPWVLLQSPTTLYPLQRLEARTTKAVCTLHLSPRFHLFRNVPSRFTQILSGSISFHLSSHSISYAPHLLQLERELCHAHLPSRRQVETMAAE
jgi:hypothetical protein